jgi:hypothetical protein
MCRLFKTQTGRRAPSMRAAGDVWEEVGTLGSGSASHFVALVLPMLPLIAPSLDFTAECRTPFREPLQFIVIAVMSVMSGTFPDTYGVFHMTVNCQCIWGPSYHRHGERHGEIGLSKLYSRPHDGDDAYDGELRAYSRCPLGLLPEMAIFNHLLERQTRSWFWPSVPFLSAVNPVLSYWPLRGSPLSPRSPLYGRGFWICGRTRAASHAPMV